MVSRHSVLSGVLGTEIMGCYPQCEMTFLGIANIHAIRKSLASLRVDSLRSDEKKEDEPLVPPTTDFESLLVCAHLHSVCVDMCIVPHVRSGVQELPPGLSSAHRKLRARLAHHSWLKHVSSVLWTPSCFVVIVMSRCTLGLAFDFTPLTHRFTLVCRSWQVPLK